MNVVNSNCIFIYYHIGIDASIVHSFSFYANGFLLNLRVFNDLNNVMNLSVKDVDGKVLVVSQFTLMASIKKGNRPSYMKASGQEHAKLMYEKFITELNFSLGKPIESGVFRAEMKVKLINDGPITIWMDSKNKQ